MTKPTRVFSFGGGVQSHAVLVAQINGLIDPFDYFVFANVGERSEHPATLEYINTVTRPLCEAHGINLVEVRKQRKGEDEDLMEAIERDNLSVPIPMYMSGGKPRNRSCTHDFKIVRVDSFCKALKVRRVRVGLGISTDEPQRIKTTEWHDSYGNGKRKRRLGFLKQVVYPLIDLRWSRQDCHNAINEFGLPPVPRSACFFCPFKHPHAWQRLRLEEPELFKRAVEIENVVNEKLRRNGRDELYLHRALVPLEQAVAMQPELIPVVDDDCSGYCHT